MESVIEAAAAKLGDPDLQLAGLRIWIHRRQFPDSADYWDGNWLEVTAGCGGSGATVFATGPIIHLSELDRFRAESENLLKELKGEASLSCIEPELSAVLKSGPHGHITMEVSITPEFMSQRHWFQFEIDQSYLPSFLGQCHAILDAYPIRGCRGG